MNHSTTRWIPRDGVKPMRIAIINRGEAAVRFMRTARVWSRRNDQPIELVAFYTDPDARAPFVQMADTAVSLGDPFMVDKSGARVSSYLDVEGLVAKCTELGVTRICPIETSRTVVKIKPNKSAQKLERSGRWSRGSYWCVST